MHGEKGSFSKTRMAGFHILPSPILDWDRGLERRPARQQRRGELQWN